MAVRFFIATILAYCCLVFAQAYYHIPPLIDMPAPKIPVAKGFFTLQGKITSDPKVEAGRMRFDLQPIDHFNGAKVRLFFDDRTQADPAPLKEPTSKAQLPSANEAAALIPPKYGDTWQCDVYLSIPRGFRNPGAAHYGLSLRAKNIIVIGTAQHHWSKHCSLIREARGVARLRQFVQALLKTATPSPGRALALALMTGDRSELTASIRDPLALVGLSHALAVSGMHVGIMGWLGFHLGWWLWRAGYVLGIRSDRTLWCVTTSLLLAGSYSMLSGFGLPAQRAFIAVAVIQVLKVVTGEVVWEAALLGSLLAVLALAPMAPMSLDFWCSFGALGLLWLVFDGYHRKAGFWRSLMQAQLLLTFGLMPAVVLMAEQWSLASPLWNAVTLPLLTFFLLPGLLLALVAALFHVQFLWTFLDLVTWLYEGLRFGVERWPLAIDLTLTHLQSFGLMGLTLCWMLPALTKYRKYALVLSLLTLLSWHRPPPNQFWLDAIDVGQGTAVVVRTRHHTLLFDAGARWRSGRDGAQIAILPFLRLQGVKKLQALVVSHEDNDHFGGVPSILRQRSPRMILSSFPLAYHLQDPQSMIHFGHAASFLCTTAKSWWWDGVLFEVFQVGGVDGWFGKNTSNNRSCLLRISAGSKAALIAGDIEAHAEQQLLQSGRVLQADILIAPHHGSATSSSTGFIRQVAPKLVVFTAAAANRFGHPSPLVVARYLVRGVTLHHTGEQGALHWRSYCPLFTLNCG